MTLPMRLRLRWLPVYNSNQQNARGLDLLVLIEVFISRGVYPLSAAPEHHPLLQHLRIYA